MVSENPNTFVHQKVISGENSAFTLVELLVVIGIIALLIAILLPSLNAARQASQRTACAAKLQQIMIAANIHSSEHNGFWPLAGFLYGENVYGNNQVGNSQYCNPLAVDDAYTSHYTYLGFTDIGSNTNGDIRILASIDLALGAEMGFKKNLNNYDSTKATQVGTDYEGMARNFLCPSQASTTSEMRQYGWVYAGNYNDSVSEGSITQISYVFNEGVLGFDDSFGRLRGKSSRVKQPSKTFFAADGLAGSINSRTSGQWRPIEPPPSQFPPPWGTYTIWNNQKVGTYNAPITLSDCLVARTNPKNFTKLGGDKENFDLLRHRGKMNIAFCDGHVESRDIPNVAKEPTAKGLMDVYLLAP